MFVKMTRNYIFSKLFHQFFSFLLLFYVFMCECVCVCLCMCYSGYVYNCVYGNSLIAPQNYGFMQMGFGICEALFLMRCFVIFLRGEMNI